MRIKNALMSCLALWVMVLPGALCAVEDPEGNEGHETKPAPEKKDKKKLPMDFYLGLAVDYDFYYLLNNDPPGTNLKKYGLVTNTISTITLDWNLGYRYSSDLLLEAGQRLGPGAYRETQYPWGSELLQTDIRSYLTTYFISPVMRVAPNDTWLGVRLGWADFSARMDAGTPALGRLGTMRQTSGAPTYGVFVRSMALTPLWFSALDIGYNYLKFTEVNNKEMTGIFTGVAAGDTNPDGSRTLLDFSGAYIRVVVNVWVQ